MSIKFEILKNTPSSQTFTFCLYKVILARLIYKRHAIYYIETMTTVQVWTEAEFTFQLFMAI
jgi:hypothetical protein